MAYTVPSLPYAYDALEPYIDELTMKIHHDRHHQAYTDNLNKAVEDLKTKHNVEKDVYELLANLDSVPEDVRSVVRNHGGGYVNHSHFWKAMKPAPPKNEPVGELAKAIKDAFGGFEQFQELYNKAATAVFGSGWAWLYYDRSAGQLKVAGYPNQDTPIMHGHVPVLGLDVWEHAYYLKYQNKRLDYIKAWWFVVNWEYAEENFQAARTGKL